MNRECAFVLSVFACGFLLIPQPATGQPPECTAVTMDYWNPQPANCGQGVNCPPKANGECVGETIWIDPNPPLKYSCTSEGAVASSNCIDWNTSQICGSAYGCEPSPFAPENCVSDSVKLRDIYFNQAGNGGSCTVVE